MGSAAAWFTCGLAFFNVYLASSHRLESVIPAILLCISRILMLILLVLNWYFCSFIIQVRYFYGYMRYSLWWCELFRLNGVCLFFLLLINLRAFYFMVVFRGVYSDGAHRMVRGYWECGVLRCIGTGPFERAKYSLIVSRIHLILFFIYTWIDFLFLFCDEEENLASVYN